jgi:hypothetical protein
MWKDIVLYGTSSIFSYFHTKQMCDNHEVMVMLTLNFIINLITMTVTILKSPVKVVDTTSLSDLR